MAQKKSKTPQTKQEASVQVQVLPQTRPDLRDLNLNDAIRIARIISNAPEERLPMIMSVFSEAGLSIDGLEQLEEWKVATEHVSVIDIREFIAALKAEFPTSDGWIEIKSNAFTEFCNARGLKARHVRKALADRELIKICKEKKKTCYTVTLRRDGEVGRYVLVKSDKI